MGSRLAESEGPGSASAVRGGVTRRVVWTGSQRLELTEPGHLECDRLFDDTDALKAAILAVESVRKAMSSVSRNWKSAGRYQAWLFGRKSEKADPDLFGLALEDMETAAECIHAAKDAKEQQIAGTSCIRKANRRSLPKHLPCLEKVIELESVLRDCGHERHVIGEDISERLDIIPARLRVIATRRPNTPAGPPRMGLPRPRCRRI